MSKKKAVLFAEKDGVLYVKVKAIMHPLIPFSDGLSVVAFGGDKNLYLKVDDAIEWCEKEKRYHPGPLRNRPDFTYDKMIETMTKAKHQMAEEIAAETEKAT